MSWVDLTFVSVSAVRTGFHPWAAQDFPGLVRPCPSAWGWKLRPIFCYFYGSHKRVHDLANCEVSSPPVKPPHFPKKLSNVRGWKSISSVDCNFQNYYDMMFVSIMSSPAPCQPLPLGHMICNVNNLAFSLNFGFWTCPRVVRSSNKVALKTELLE